jgi:hypothetical protein
MAEVLDYATPPKRQARSFAETMRSIVTIGGLVLALFGLVESQFLLTAAGGMVGHYLLVVPPALLALGWSRKTWMKIVAMLIVLLAVFMAHRDHVTGKVRMEQILKTKYMAEGRAAAATQLATPATQPAP